MNILGILYEKVKFNFLFQKLILISTLFLASCAPKDQLCKKCQLTKEERIHLNLFFKHLLLREHGIYVLFGSKPMIACQAISLTEQEQIENYEKLNIDKKDIKWIQIAFDFKWWDDVKDRINLNQYLIFQKDTSFPKVKDVFLVNISNMILLLQKNYDLFKKVVGYDFSPLEVVFEMDKTSIFWDKVFNNSLLLGLVYGYGFDNAYLFNFMRNVTESSSGKEHNYVNSFSKIFKSHISDHEKQLILSDCTDNKLNYQDFPLPTYRSLFDNLQKKQYLKEQKKIKKIYKGKDPLEVTLNKLCE